jgi:hypothetical protein
MTKQSTYTIVIHMIVKTITLTNTKLDISIIQIPPICLLLVFTLIVYVITVIKLTLIS